MDPLVGDESSWATDDFSSLGAGILEFSLPASPWSLSSSSLGRGKATQQQNGDEFLDACLPCWELPDASNSGGTHQRAQRPPGARALPLPLRFSSRVALVPPRAFPTAAKDAREALPEDALAHVLSFLPFQVTARLWAQDACLPACRRHCS